MLLLKMLFLCCRMLPLMMCVYILMCVSVSGGHGGAAAGVYVEETRVRAAEAQRPSAETGFRGDRPAV